MKLRAMIIIDFEANDIMDAKDKIEQLQNDLDRLKVSTEILNSQ